MNIGDTVMLTVDITLEQAVTGRIVRMGKRRVKLSKRCQRRAQELDEKIQSFVNSEAGMVPLAHARPSRGPPAACEHPNRASCRSQ